jgi:chromate reductase, NAD(P)H dehydrogenase (quinone)
MTYQIGYIVGSLSTQSINRKLAEALIKLAPGSLAFVEIPIGELPLYNHDYDEHYPLQGTALKDAIADVDAILFITPEYNRSIPGALKNAIDWASRPWGTNSLAGKPAAVIGASTGGIASAVGQQHLKSILGFTDSPLMGQPEGYVNYTETLIDDSGVITDEGTRDFLTRYLISFHAHIEKNLGSRAA